jgi:hypothetical protein
MSDTAPDFRALCAELVELLDSEWFGVSYQPPALDRARAALATTPPEPPNWRTNHGNTYTQHCSNGN